MNLICIIAVDSSSACELVRSILENLGLEIWETEDGDTAISLVRAHPPDLLIVDAGLARIDGIAIIAQLRACDLIQRAKVVALAGGPHEMQHPMLTRSKIDRVLVKPLRAAHLRTTIAQLLPILGTH